MRIADDFGLGRRHDRAILSLLEKGRLDGTSVMMGSAMEPGDIGRLRELRQAGTLVGLHLNLTQAIPGGGPVWPLNRLIWPRRDGQALNAITSSLTDQANRFIQLFGSSPDFYDGHQHCHCFPAIAPLVVRLPRTSQTWVRVPLPATWKGRWLNCLAGGAKAFIVMALAARAGGIFARAGLNTNRDFTGFLRLHDPSSVRRWLPRLLSAKDPDCLIMLHPGDATDNIQCAGHAPASRSAETEILTGNAVG